jgi:hypothetical protein
MLIPETISNARGRPWRVSTLTDAESRAYKRPKEAAPRFRATGPLGSIIHAATLADLEFRVRRATHQ